MTKEQEIKTFEITMKADKHTSTIEVRGTKIKWEPMNETYVLITIYDETGNEYWWYLTEHPILCKVIEKTSVHKVVKNKNVVRIDERKDESVGESS